MDIQSFLQSGLLEAYALAQCTPAERTQVEEMLAQYPEARAELESIELALERYANAQAVTPPADLKERILRELDRVEVPMTAPADNLLLRIFQASTVLLLAAAIYFGYQQSQTRTQLDDAQNRNTELEKQVADCGNSVNAERAIVRLLHHQKTKAVKMGNINDASAIPVYVFHNFESGNCTALVDVSVLPKPPAGKYLQFWALVDGVPKEMGMIDISSANGLQSFPCEPKATGFAVSIEDNPKGNRKPTEVLLLGMQG